MSRWSRCVVHVGESTKSGESSGGSEAHTSGCISTIWKRAKPTPSRLCTVPGVVGSSSAKTSRESILDRTGGGSAGPLLRASTGSRFTVAPCLYRVRDPAREKELLYQSIGRRMKMPYSSSGAGDAQDDPLLWAKFDQTLDTHDHPVP